MTIAEKLQQIAENEQKVYNAGFKAGKAESGGITPIDYLSLYFNIENKEEWTVGEFTLLSDATSGYLTIPNPAGQVPKEFVVFTKTPNELVKKSLAMNGEGVLAGGYNVGNILDDKDDNRTIAVKRANVKSQNFTDYAIAATLYNLVNASCPSIATSENLYFRTGTINATKWYAGEYYVAVRV